MKISPFDSTISTSRRSTRTVEKELQINIDFSDVLGRQIVTAGKSNKPNELKSLTVNWDDGGTTTYYPAWFKEISQCDCYGVHPSDPLSEELGKLSQMLNMFFEELVSCKTHNTSIEPHKFQLSRIRKVAMDRMDLQNPDYSGYHYRETQISHYAHEEEKSYAGTATLVTKGGEKINFSFDVGMNRRFFRDEQITWGHQSSEANPVEPLVLRLETPLPKMSAVTFDFNLINGQEANTENEATKGSGFLELTTYDPDRHLWIDINDHIFNNLPIWEESESV